MSMFDGILSNIDDVAAKLGIPPDQVQAVVDNLKGKLANGGDPLAAISAAAQEHGISLESLQGIMPCGANGLLAQAESMLDRDGDGNALNDLEGMAKGLFGKS